jgi:hypothetical protein
LSAGGEQFSVTFHAPKRQSSKPHYTMSKDWQIPRRTFLRGLGTAIALPVFEAMLPSVRALADTAGEAGKAGLTPAGFPKRMAFVYTPNGANMAQWAPKGVGFDYKLSPTLEPLAAYKAGFLRAHRPHAQERVRHGRRRRRPRPRLRHLPHRQAPEEIRLRHPRRHLHRPGRRQRDRRADAAALAGTELRPRPGGRLLRFRLQLRLPVQHFLAVRDPADEPRDRAQGGAFDRLFGVDATPGEKEAQARRDHYNTSILDAVQDQAKRPGGSLGGNDRASSTSISRLDPRPRAPHPAERHPAPARSGRRHRPIFNAEYSFQNGTCT